ncbi:MAG TPA: HlyD family secretion protein [Acidobacteriaceae bacterium]
MAEQDPESGRAGNENQQQSSDQEQRQNPEKKRRRSFILFFVIAVLVVGALLYYWHSTFYEDTDDAQINGHIIQISARINGHIINVPVKENQEVPAGTVIAEIDPHDYEVLVAQGEANLEAAEAAYEAAKVNVPVTNVQSYSSLSSANANVLASDAQVKRAARMLDQAQAEVAQAEANNTKAQLDLKRYTTLVAKDVISKQQYDQAVAAAQASEASVESAKANAIAAREQIAVARQQGLASVAEQRNARSAPQIVAAQKAKADQAAAQVEQARAQLNQAKLNLSYTKIVAPVDGIITTKNVEVGQNVSPGQNLVTLVSLHDLWVTANFKETQLHLMRPNQTVKIHVDMNGRDYDGVVTQIGGATGSMLSLFPPENATGNYVKVVQRVPVRIDFSKPEEDKEHVLRPGLSVEPTVRVKGA